MGQSTRIMPTLPFTLAELPRPDEEVERLFRRLFRAPAPDYPRHFVAYHSEGAERRLAAYVHYTAAEPGVFLIGGLGVDASVYRRLSPGQKDALAGRGSLSRWLLERSITALEGKRAVFAYTGDTRSRRDIEALGFARAAGAFLWVQWHAEPQAARASLVARIDALGPF